MFTIEEVKKTTEPAYVFYHARATSRQSNQKKESNPMNRKTISTTLALLISCSLMVFAQTPQFNIIKPSTTGVPGDEVRLMGFDPAGNLWVGTRMVYWDQVALAMLPANQIDYHPFQVAVSIPVRGRSGQLFTVIRSRPFISEVLPLVMTAQSGSAAKAA